MHRGGGKPLRKAPGFAYAHCFLTSKSRSKCEEASHSSPRHPLQEGSREKPRAQPGIEPGTTHICFCKRNCSRSAYHTTRPLGRCLRRGQRSTDSYRPNCHSFPPSRSEYTQPCSRLPSNCPPQINLKFYLSVYFSCKYLLVRGHRHLTGITTPLEHIL